MRAGVNLGSTLAQFQVILSFPFTSNRQSWTPQQQLQPQSIQTSDKSVQDGVIFT
jgi:hypothetical protein